MSNSNIKNGDFSARRQRSQLPSAQILGFGLALITIVLVAVLGDSTVREQARTASDVDRTMQIVQGLQDVLSAIKDAEIGQRGYLLTENESYLAPYNAADAALPSRIATLKALVSDQPDQLDRVQTVERLTADRLSVVKLTVEWVRAGDREQALGIVNSDRGKDAMDLIRAHIEQIHTQERVRLEQRRNASEAATRVSAAVIWIGCGVLLLMIIANAIVSARDFRSREAQVWMRAGQTGLVEHIQGEHCVAVLSTKALQFLAEYLDAQVGAVYLTDDGGRYERVAGYALSPNAPQQLSASEGLLGQAITQNRPLQVREVPAEYLDIASSLGRSRPHELLIVPASADGHVHAVVELGFTRATELPDRELLARVSEMFGVAIRSSKDRARMQSLLEEMQAQSEELQAQQEELRVNNEELEEQSKFLVESQTLLEAQQAELEQTNAQLEAQSQQLEAQRDQVIESQQVLIQKTGELERASRYKNEFLANMSHELRTPLNSTLILAKLLSDNAPGNLNGEQISFAQTIHAAGIDLLALINDILDLAKIEAGKIDLRMQVIAIKPMLESLDKAFRPVAEQKGLKLVFDVDAQTPEHMSTDPMRFGQVLRNLLSNAIKFTHTGEVAVRVSSIADSTLSFTVHDTGIGIDASNIDLIFEAFRQADGSTHRKYGGTGLGLSISRDLARLLGGELTVHSTLGKGSQFQLRLPMEGGPLVRELTEEQQNMDAEAQLIAQRASALMASSSELASAPIPDDRDTLNPDQRAILVVEDDPRFATILRDLIREMGFQSIVTGSAHDGLVAALRFRPRAIVLDMRLPDLSGLGVLDRLKRNAQTRHIPVHVVSVADHEQEAIELGAVSYALKPVPREQLVASLRRLEEKSNQNVRQLLIIEDDPHQLDSIRRLFQNDDITITGAESAEAALALLQTHTFDCVVMDLNLPQMSGYELLERMAASEDISFPSVIVHTARSLTRDEESRLQRYSRSIIVKDGRSPERLLDEVTLFLHQVEAKLPADSQRILSAARDRDSMLDGKRILVVEDDVRNIFALTRILEPKGATIDIARNGLEAISALERSVLADGNPIDLVLMDIMMPEMDGLTAMREIRKRAPFNRLPIIALTAKAMKDDQEKCVSAGANDYIAKPLDVDKLLSLVRIWMPK